MVARICEALSLHGSERVLDVGTGSGYQAAVLAELAGEVHTIERLPELAEKPRERLAERRLRGRVHVHVGDGTLGLPEQAPFDAIAVAAAAPELPASLYEQLAAARTARRAGRQASWPAAPADRPKPRGPGDRAIGVLPVRAPARRGGLRGLTGGPGRQTVPGMSGVSAESLLRLPVRVRGIELGRPVDLVLDRERTRVLGFEVLCGDEERRFLPLAVATIRESELEVALVPRAARSSRARLLHEARHHVRRAQGLAA